MLGQLAGYFLSGPQTELDDEVASASALTPSQASADENGAPHKCGSTDPDLDGWVVVADDAEVENDALETGDATAGTVGDSSAPGTPCSNQTVEDNWTLTPAGCFHVRMFSPLRPASSRENLLMEQASMSVFSRPQQEQQQAAASGRVKRRAATTASTTDASLAARQLSKTAQLAAAQQVVSRQGRKWLGQTCLNRGNKAREIESAGNQRQRRRHHYNMRHSGANNSRKC